MRFIFATWTHYPSQNIRNRLPYLPVCRRALVALLERLASQTPSSSVSILCGAKKLILKGIYTVTSENDHSSSHYKIVFPVNDTCGIRSLDSFTQRRACLASRCRPITSWSLRRFSRVRLLFLASSDDCSTSSVQRSQPGPS